MQPYHQATSIFIEARRGNYLILQSCSIHPPLMQHCSLGKSSQAKNWVLFYIRKKLMNEFALEQSFSKAVSLFLFWDVLFIIIVSKEPHEPFFEVGILSCLILVISHCSHVLKRMSFQCPLPHKIHMLLFIFLNFLHYGTSCYCKIISEPFMCFIVDMMT